MQKKEDLTIIIMGATGDLTKLKLIPAIYNILKSKGVGKLAVVGVSFSKKTAEEVLMGSKPNIKDFDEHTWNELKSIFHYYSLDFNKPEDYQNLKLKIQEVETKEGLPGNRLFYLATLPEHFAAITENLGKNQLINQKDAWQRVIYEKPFGHDLA